MLACLPGGTAGREGRNRGRRRGWLGLASDDLIAFIETSQQNLAEIQGPDAIVDLLESM